MITVGLTRGIGVTPDLTLNRIGVELKGWAAADGPITVYRVHPDSTEWVVRGFTNTSGGAAFAFDYEAPFAVPVTYYAFDGTIKNVSAAVTLTTTVPVLRAPGLPANDAYFDLMAKPTVKYPRATTVLVPLGRATPIVLSSARQTGEFTFMAETRTSAAASALAACVTQSLVCLLVIPNSRQAWQYVAIGEVTEVPVAPMLSVTDGDAGSWVQWSITCTVVDRPVGGVFGDPTASYAQVLTSYATYDALLAGKASYLDVLKGV